MSKTYTRYKNLKKAEIYLEEHVAKYLKNANPKSKEDIQFWMKKAEEDLYGRKGFARKMPKEVLQVIKSTRGDTSGRWKGAALTTASTFLGTAAHNITTLAINRQNEKMNRKLLKAGKQPIEKKPYMPWIKSSLMAKSKPGPLDAQGYNIIGLLENIRGERWLTEDIMGTRMAADVNPEALAGLNLEQNTTDPGATNLHYDKRFDNVTHKDRINQERTLFSKLQKGNANYDNVFYMSGSSWRSQLNKDSPNYYVKKSNNGEALSIANKNQYGGTAPFDMNQGRTPWTDRSVRGPKQANDETRSLFISMGADEKQVNRLSNDVLSRFRISGGFETDTNLQLLNDDGANINLKLNRNSLATSSGRVYEGTPVATKRTPKTDLTIKENKKSFQQRLSESFSDPLE